MLTIRPALDSEVAELSRLRLEALRTEPAAFSRDYDADRKNSAADWETWFRERSDGVNGVIFVAHADSGLAGMAGMARGHTPKIRHGGMIWGVYVRPDFRRNGVGGQLTQACIEWAEAQGVDVIRLGVNSANVAAIRLYAACGFQVCGLSPRAVRHGGKDYDELMMVWVT